MSAHLRHWQPCKMHFVNPEGGAQYFMHKELFFGGWIGVYFSPGDDVGLDNGCPPYPWEPNGVPPTLPWYDVNDDFSGGIE